MGGLGFRDMEIYNLALLAKQVWRILCDPNTLSARLLKAVYFPASDILSAQVGSRPSQIWRSLCEGRDILRTGLIKHIGDGENTNIWNDNWLPRDYNMHPISVISPNPQDKVTDLISQVDRTWDEQALTEHLLPMDADIVRQIPLSHTNQCDFYAWPYEKSGVFSVRSCYKMVMETKMRRKKWLTGGTDPSNTFQQESNWKKLWGIQVPAKLRIFAWRLVWASLPTGQERQRRHMSKEVVCPICQAACDTWRHALLDCNMSKSV